MQAQNLYLKKNNNNDIDHYVLDLLILRVEMVFLTFRAWAGGRRIGHKCFFLNSLPRINLTMCETINLIFIPTLKYTAIHILSFISFVRRTPLVKMNLILLQKNIEKIRQLKLFIITSCKQMGEFNLIPNFLQQHIEAFEKSPFECVQTQMPHAIFQLAHNFLWDNQN